MRFSVSGDPYHTRCLSVAVYESGEGRVRFQGDVIDLRKAGFIPLMGDFQSAGIIHKMALCGEVGIGSGVLERIEGAQPNVAFEPSAASRGECCRDPIDRIQALVGESLNGEFSRALSREMGGALGCSHLLTLFQLIASTLPRVLALEREAGNISGRRADGERIFNRSLFVDGLGTDEGLQLTSSLSDVHTRPSCDVGGSVGRLARHDEVRVLADVTLSNLSLSNLLAGERRRSAEEYADTRWKDRSVEVAELVGSSLMAGFAGKVFTCFRGRAEDRLLLDALLNLAPGLIQVLTALTDRPSPPGDSGNEQGLGGGLMEVVGMGGREDSCYMWRKGSPLMQIREKVQPRD